MPQADFVGRAVCAGCHAGETARGKARITTWRCRRRTSDTVLGDFDNASITHFGVTSTFFRKDGKFFVRTDGPDGTLHDYDIAYTFGVYPLQQYLIAFPGGRYQALPLAWDSRPKDQGGQRWFHLYPGERLSRRRSAALDRDEPDLELMCADCHSTNLRRNYDPSTDSYHTSWSEIDVSCEACHGPGSRHVAWAKEPSAQPPDDKQGSRGLPRRPERRALGARSGDRHGKAHGAAFLECRDRDLRSLSQPPARDCLHLRLWPSAARQRDPQPAGRRRSTFPTGRSRRRTTSTAPSCRARCSPWASLAPTVTTRTA